MSSLIVAAQNWPHRLRGHNPKAGFQKLANMGADIICAEEHADIDNWSPRGWKRYRRRQRSPRRSTSTPTWWTRSVAGMCRCPARTSTSTGD